MRFVLLVAGLLFVGLVAVWLIKALLGLFFYILVGALVVGGGVYLYGRIRRAITGQNRTRLPY
jgi:hypothetical protein